MKHSTGDSFFQTNLLQALQKNKLIQGKLTECERLYYVQLLKDLQAYNVKEKYNRELLYTWKKESYVRQLRKNLQEYEKKKFGARDAYYEYQLRNLVNIIAGQQSLVIPPSEEERRLNINAKYHEFLEKNPLQASSSTRSVKSANIPTEQNKSEIEKEEENVRGLEDTWKPIHAQSAVGLRRKPDNIFPSIHRPSTRNEIQKNKVLTKSLTPLTVADVSSTLVTTTSEVVTSSSNEKFQRSPNKSSSNYFELSDSIEPILITSETLDRHTRADLVKMRSVRRPRKNPSDLNLLFETRKRIYQINRRALDYQLYQRKCQLQPNIQFNRSKQIDSIKHLENLPDTTGENLQKELDDKIIS